MNKRAQKKPILVVLILLTIIIIALLSAVWLGYGSFKQASTNKIISSANLSPETKLIFTVVGIIILTYSWFSFFRQKNRDQSQSPTSTDNIFVTAHKIGGWHLAFKAVMGCITAIFLFVISILLYAGFFIQDSIRIYLATFILKVIIAKTD